MISWDSFDLQHQLFQFASMTALPLEDEKERQRTQHSANSSDTNVIPVTEPESGCQMIDIPEKAASGGIDPDDDGYPQGLRLFCIVVALGMSIFLVALDMVRFTICHRGACLLIIEKTIVATAIPKITDQFHSLDDVSWYGSAFLMTTGGFQSTWGKAYKYFPVKISFLVSVFLFELGSLVCGVAPNSVALIVGRAIAGIGAAGIGGGVFIIIAFIASPKRRPVFTGIVGMSYGIASVVGPLVGGAFADQVTWRWCKNFYYPALQRLLPAADCY